MSESTPRPNPHHLPPAGWHPDPYSPGQDRWWSGSGWTGKVRQSSAAPTAATTGSATTSGPTAPPPRRSPDTGSLTRRWWFKPAVYGAVALTIFGIGRASAAVDPTGTPAYRSLEDSRAATLDELSTVQAALTSAEHERDVAQTQAAQASADLDTATAALSDLKAGIVTTTVTTIVDGDTIDTAAGTVRVIGIDAPEQGQCNYAGATENLGTLIPVGSTVRLIPVEAKGDADESGRLLRYVESDGKDAGLEQITSGYAIARYDSRDGHGAHPREADYIAADEANDPPDDSECAIQEREAAAAAQAAAAAAAAAEQAAAAQAQADAEARAAADARVGCDPSYPTVCIPPAPPDLDCGDILYHRFTVVGNDPHGFDGDHDGVGCES